MSLVQIILAVIIMISWFVLIHGFIDYVSRPEHKNKVFVPLFWFIALFLYISMGYAWVTELVRI